jgi:glycerate-2-kinase
MKFDIMKLIRNSLLVSFMLGSSAFMFNNVYAVTTSTSSSPAATADEAAAVQKWQKATSEAYSKWLETDAGKKATQDDKSKQNETIAASEYEKLSDSDKKLINSYAAKFQNSSKSSSSNNSTKKSSSSSKSTTKKSNTSEASAKTKTGDPCCLSMLGLSLLGSFGTCVLYRKKQ